MGLRELRQRRGLTQVQLADMTGMAQATISEYEIGKKNITLMSLGVALRLSKALNCSPSELLGD